MLALTNDDIEKILTMEVCLEAMEESFRANALGESVNTPWCNMYTQQGESENSPVHHVLRTSMGCVSNTGIAAIRINSEIFKWVPVASRKRKVKTSDFEGKPLTGFILLFENSTGMPVALMPDRYVDKTRVAATNGLGVKYLSRSNAKTIGLLGTGWQATSQLRAFCCVRPIEKVKVYSPTEANRLRFSQDMKQILGIPVKAVSTAEEAVEGVDIIAAATNSIDPVIQSEWLKPGIHISILKELEVSAQVMDRCDVISANLRTPLKAPVEFFAKGGWSHTSEGLDDFVPGLEVRRDWWHNQSYWKRMASLEDLITEAKPGRQKDSDITLFLSRGVAHQFSSTGAKILQLAHAKGIGHPMPIENLLRY